MQDSNLTTSCRRSNLVLQCPWWNTNGSRRRLEGILLGWKHDKLGSFLPGIFQCLGGLWSLQYGSGNWSSSCAQRPHFAEHSRCEEQGHPILLHSEPWEG